VSKSRVLALAVVVTVLQGAPARADEFSDFRIPDHRVFSWTGDFGASGGQRTDSFGSLLRRSNGLSGSASSNAAWQHDSDPATSALFVGFTVNGRRNHDDSQDRFEDPFGDVTFERRSTHDRSVFESWSASAETRRYPWTLPFGATLRADGSGNFGQIWQSQSNTRQVQTPFFSEEFRVAERDVRWSYLHQARASAGIGVGRVRDATMVYDVHVMEERLLLAGSLNRPLSAQARLRLAELLYMRGAVGQVHDRPARLVWREIERILREDGAPKGDALDPWSVVRSAEPYLGGPTDSRDYFPRSPIARLTGYFVGPQVTLATRHNVFRSENQSLQEFVLTDTTFGDSSSHFQRDVQSSDQALGVLVAEYHRPVGPRWQLDARGRVFTPLRREGGKDLQEQSSIELAWIVSDRWLGRASIAHRWLDEDRTQGPTRLDSWQWGYGADVHYFLEDHVGIGLGCGGGQSWTRGNALGIPHDYSRSTSFSLSMSYRFAGFFQAPDLLPAGLGDSGTRLD
jgi:hypothetical protein